MKRLEDRRLVQRSRSGRRSSIRLLREDGTGEPYDHPYKTGDARWLQLPYAYWHEGHYMRLSLPAKALLLVALSLDDGFYLPSERAQDWYGVSPDTAERGLRELRNSGLLHDDRKWIRDHHSATGWTERWTYTLKGSFSRDARHAAATARRGKGGVEE